MIPFFLNMAPVTGTSTEQRDGVSRAAACPPLRGYVSAEAQAGVDCTGAAHPFTLPLHLGEGALNCTCEVLPDDDPPPPLDLQWLLQQPF